VADLAVALAYAILDKPDPVEAAAHVVRGYHAANPLGEEEPVLLFDLVKLRLCLSVALAARQSRQRPGDDYLTISQAAIRRTLPRLIAMDPRFLESAMLTRIAARRGPSPVPETETPQAPAIRPHVGRSLRLAYRRPVHIARASMQYVYDSDGRRLLDAYNNVPHVGHCHPDVVRAAEQQLRLLNTNTRYVHDSLEAFARELAATMPDPLSVCYFVNSGSEANELAIRLARVHTGRRDVLVLEHAYHGITTTLTDISPYKFDGPGGDGRQAWVHVAPIPDVYRGRYRDDLATAGKRYADDARLIVEHLMQDRALAAFIAESAPSVAGQIILPPGYLERTYASVRAAGAVCIADEVQTAYGRMGTHFYAFQAHDVVPDIVVLGKPIGNGYPLGAVVTTPEIAASFDNGLELFSTFGGSTVSCAVGRAVLDVVRRERVEEHARRTGGRLLEALRDLQGPHPVVGDVRGSGLYLGVELVTDREARRPATAEADYVVNRLREEGILIGTDGPQHNVLKIRPPMPFSDDDAGLLVGTLDRILREMREQGGRRQP
jgi:4-aminobutyrate aminotransferase-like enzyme